MNDEDKDFLLNDESRKGSVGSKPAEDTFSRSTNSKNSTHTSLDNDMSDVAQNLRGVDDVAKKATHEDIDRTEQLSASRVIKSAEYQQSAKDSKKSAQGMATPLKDQGQQKLSIEEIKDLYGEVLFDISIELGRKFVSVEDMLNWQNGAIIRLDKTSGEPVDFLINGKPVAFGEIMMLDERFGVRVTEILSKERVVEKYKDGLYEK